MPTLTRMARMRLVWLVVGVTLLAACAQAVAADSGRSLEAARKFDGFRLYYAGKSFEDSSLSDVSSYRDFGHRWWSFIYEHCTPISCDETFEIQDWSICTRYPARYPGHLRAHRFRGAKAMWNPYAGAFEVYT